jgi:hypothetical protein
LFLLMQMVNTRPTRRRSFLPLAGTFSRALANSIWAVPSAPTDVDNTASAITLPEEIPLNPAGDGEPPFSNIPTAGEQEEEDDNLLGDTAASTGLTLHPPNPEETESEYFARL